MVVELERDPLTGKRRRIYRTAKTERAAERLKAKLTTQVADGEAQGPEKRTVADLAAAWLTHIAPNRSPSTMINYRTKVKGYIVPNLGKVRLDRLKAVQLDGLYSTLRKSGGHEGKPLSAQTVRHVHAILHAMLAQGRKWGWVTRNPAEDATAPTPDPVDNDPPSPEQVAVLYHQAVIEDRNLALAIWVCAVAGTRRAEACGLRWSDLDGNMLAVARSIVVAGKGELRVKSTKTGKPRRVGLDAHTVELFAEHRRLAEERAEVCRVDIDPGGFVLSESPSCADPLHPDVLTKRFQRLAAKLGIDCHMHSLRHFSVSVALGAGRPVLEVAQRSGHASARMTLDRYGHVMSVGAESAEVISGALRKG